MKFRNEYKQLKQENNLIFSTLAECDRDTITDILNTVSNSRGINYDVELVRKDLIAMAASAITMTVVRACSALVCPVARRITMRRTRATEALIQVRDVHMGASNCNDGDDCGSPTSRGTQLCTVSCVSTDSSFTRSV